MLYRTHDGLDISEIGIGCYALSGAYGQKDPAAFKAMLHRAYELGVNFFDTADAYGDAEAILGEVVKPFREEVLIATKVGVKESTKPNLSAEYLQSSCEESLRRLGTEYIDLYQIHFDDPETPVEETIAVMEELKAQGKIRRYGLGHLSPPRVTAYLEKGNVFSVLLELNAVARDSHRDLLSLCQKHDVGMIAFSVTGRGLLTGKFQEVPTFEEGDIRKLDIFFQRERFQYGLQVMEKLAEIGRRYGKTPAQTAIAWVLAQKGVICALTGPSTIPHLEENLQASGWRFTSQELDELTRFLEEEEEKYNQLAEDNIKEIITEPLPGNPSSAFRDLIYVIETALRLGMVKELEVMPTFYKLYNLRKELDDQAAPELSAIQGKLRELI
ncbi:MAG: aldo/keto reductase [Anaerolineales bacterium]